MHSTKAFIFDFNGVLFWDSHLHEKAWKDYSKQLRGHELSDDEMYHYIHGRTNEDVLEYILGRPLSGEELAHHIATKEYTYQQMCFNSGDQFTLSPGAVEMLDYLKQHEIPRTIATSSEIGNLRFFFEHFNLANWFNIDTVAYDDGTIKGKPAPDLYLRAVAKLDVSAPDCTVIEDAKSGIASAHAAGIGHIIALGPVKSHAELSALQGVGQTIVDFTELLQELLAVET